MTADPDDHPGRARRPATEEEARALASAVRLRILRVTLDEALTNKEIAQRLGRNPASILHHVRRLVDTGFLVPEAERRGRRGAREVPYRATGKSWDLSVSEQRPAQMQAGREAMLAAFVEEAGQSDLSAARMTRLGQRLTPEEMAEFLCRVDRLFDEYHDRPASEHGEPYGVFFMVYPDRR